MKLSEQTLDHWTALAQQIATGAHAGQERTNGSPYINHPARIAAKAPDRLKPIAWLHDVPEDTNITIGVLKEAGFPSYIIQAVDLLTHRKGDSNMMYWTKILTNPDAIAIKLLDIQDNMNETPSEYAKAKYAKALALFKKHGHSL